MNKSAILPAIPTTEDFASGGKLSSVESQRIMSVLLEMQKKIHLVGLIQHSMDERISSTLTAESSLLIEVQFC